MPSQRTFGRRLSLIVTAGLALRLALVQLWSSHLVPAGDQIFYLRQAQYLGQGYGFVYRNPMHLLGAPAGGYAELIPTAAHPPLYTAWLGLVGLAGAGLDPDSHLPYRLATALLGAATIAVIGLAAREVAGSRAGLIAAGLATVYPNLWLNDVLLFSESIYTLTIALVIWASAAFIRSASTRNALFLGASVALAALARAEALLLLVLLVVPLVALARRPAGHGPPRARLRLLVCSLGAALIVIAPWLVRNAVVFERRPPTISNGTGYVIEISNCDQTYGLAPQHGPDGALLPAEEADAMLGYWAAECDRTPWVPGDETETAAAKLRTGVTYIRDHAARFPLVVAARVGRIWDVWRPGQSRDLNAYLEGRGMTGATLAMVMYYPLALLAVAGLEVLRRRSGARVLVPYLAIIVMTTLTAAVSFGITRYRAGAEVALTVLAGVALDTLAREVVRRRSAARRPDGRGSDVTAAGSQVTVPS